MEGDKKRNYALNCNDLSRGCSKPFSYSSEGRKVEHRGREDIVDRKFINREFIPFDVPPAVAPLHRSR